MNLLDFALGIAAAFLAEELFGWVDRLGQWLVCRAARKLPEEQARRYEQEWRQEFSSLPKFSRLVFAVDLQRAAFVMNHQMTLPHVSIFIAALVRLIDIVGAVLLILVTFPMLALGVIGLKTQRGVRSPVIERLERVGYMGRRFSLLKLMVSDPSVSLRSGERPRIRGLAWLVYLARIDELPTTLNVLRGDMSFVGPRPESPEFARLLAEHFPEYSERQRVRPGITGLAQVRQPYAGTLALARRKLEYDLEFVTSFGVWRYVSIFLETVWIVLVHRR